jgi:hypothetical protein
MSVVMLSVSLAFAGQVRVEVDGLRALVQDTPPYLASGAPVSGCAPGAPADLDAPEAWLTRAERALAYLDLAEVADQLRGAERALVCAPPPIAAATAAKVSFLSGVMAAERGDPEVAGQHFRDAVGIDPDLPWDPNQSDAVRVLFEAARSAVAVALPAQIRVTPTPTDAELWVDGRALTATEGVVLVSGLHYLRVVRGDAAQTFAFRVGDGPDTLFVPSLFTDDHGAWIDDPDQSADVTSLVRAAVGPAARVSIDLDGPTYHLQPDGAWAASQPRRGCARAAPPLVVSGATTVAVGAAWWLVSGVALGAARRDYAASSDPAIYYDAAGRYALAGQQVVAARVASAAGGGLIGAGVVCAVATKGDKP